MNCLKCFIIAFVIYASLSIIIAVGYFYLEKARGLIKDFIEIIKNFKQ